MQSEGQEDIPWGDKEETEMSVWAKDFAASGRVHMVATNATGENDQRSVTATLVSAANKSLCVFIIRITDFLKNTFL